MDDVKDFLASLLLFRGFSSEQLDRLVGASELCEFDVGGLIIQYGQPGRFLGIVVDGEAEAVLPAGDSGTGRRLGLLKKGDVLGEMSLLTGEPTNADVIALQKSRVLLVPQDVFSRLIMVNPQATMLLARTLSERLRSRQRDEEAQARIENARRNMTDPYGLELSAIRPTKILVINCGSSSLKYSYFDTAHVTNNIEGIVDRIGLTDPYLTFRSSKVQTRTDVVVQGYHQAFEAVINAILGSGVLDSLDQLTAVGHRVVHGGDKYDGATLINVQVIEDIRKNSSLAPLHNPLSLMAIEASMKLLPNTLQVAVFDTGFHQRMPPQAYLYALPYELYEKDKIRRYGFHGISHNYAGLKAAEYLKRGFRELRTISCHLGNGASVCAIDHGRSVDTSMGLTPLEGLMMGTRSGDIDPSIVFYLCRERKMSIDQVDEFLNKQSGLKGMSGISSDFRDLEAAAGIGEPRAIQTVNSFCYRVRKYVGAYVAALGGIEVLVFTGGIGEGSAWARALTCQGLDYMGIRLDDDLNRVASTEGKVTEISQADSPVKILIVPADEARMIARETIRVLGKQVANDAISSQRVRPIPIEISAHHVHLSARDVDALFGVGYQLTYRSDLSQPGQYACVETVNLVGPRGSVANVRVLGPLRKESQVEISRTEEFKLGIKAPVRASGDLDGSPPMRIEGTRGAVDIPQGVICALRHIHMTPEDALYFGLRDGDTVMMRVEGERALVFGDTLVRVGPDYRLAMHIDTDEANAAGIAGEAEGNLVGVQERR